MINRTNYIAIMITLYLSFHLQIAKSQDAQFSQFYNSPLLLNPSMAGAFNGKARLQLNTRNQWRSISEPYNTYGFSVDMGLKQKKGSNGFLGVGLTSLSDKAGNTELKVNQVNIAVAYHSKLSYYSSLSAGIQGGFVQTGVNDDKYQWNSQYDGIHYNENLPSYESNTLQNKSYSDFGGGLKWNYKKKETTITSNNQLIVEAGFALLHATKPNNSYYDLSNYKSPLKVLINGSAHIGIKNTNYSFLPSVQFIQQGSMKNFIFGGIVRLKLKEESIHTNVIKGTSISIGGLYRIEDAIIPYIQLEYSDYCLGLSYDINVSKLSNATTGRGAFELSLRWIFHNSASNKNTSMF